MPNTEYLTPALQGVPETSAGFHTPIHAETPTDDFTSRAKAEMWPEKRPFYCDPEPFHSLWWAPWSHSEGWTLLSLSCNPVIKGFERLMASLQEVVLRAWLGGFQGTRIF